MTPPHKMDCSHQWFTLSNATELKRKPMRRYSYGIEMTSVQLRLDATSYAGHRTYDVFTDGLHVTYLGQIHEYTGRLTTKIKGTRQVRHGRSRTFWSASKPGERDRNYWMHNESQSGAIRWLLDAHETQMRQAK